MEGANSTVFSLSPIIFFITWAKPIDIFELLNLRMHKRSFGLRFQRTKKTEKSAVTIYGPILLLLSPINCRKASDDRNKTMITIFQFKSKKVQQYINQFICQVDMSTEDKSPAAIQHFSQIKGSGCYFQLEEIFNVIKPI